jgi:beta-glucosidase
MKNKNSILQLKRITAGAARRFFPSLAGLCLLIVAGLPACEDPAVRDRELKITVLLKKMTVEEKIGQLVQQTSVGFSAGMADQVRNGQIGSILNETDPETIYRLQQAAFEESRLQVPLLFARDVIHGYKTIYPVPLGQAASWNPALVRESGRATAIEATSAGIRWTFAPMLDVCRDPRWGRIVEGFGEDPYLTSILGIATVNGFQGDSLNDPTSLIACAKHFAGYGAAEGGRDYNTTVLSPEQLGNTYLPPFKAAIATGAGSVMVSFNEINGVPNSGNSYLLQDILRREWGFDGLVVSDWNSIGEMRNHGYVADQAQAAEIALKAGVDMDMESHAYRNQLRNLVKQGKIKKKELNAAVRHVLRLKFRAGLFDNPYPELREPVFYAPAHLALAREFALQSAILLKNDRKTLPLDSAVTSVAVIGPLADAPHDQLGTWVFDGEKSHTVTPLAALRKSYASRVTINYAPGLDYSRDESREQFADALAAARASDVVLFFGGEESILSGEAHSRADISLPGAQKALLAELAQTGKPVVLVVMAGRPIEIDKELPLVDAYLFSFHPGTMGGPALVDLLFGKASPSGKLPVTYPKTVGQVPLYYNHKNTGRPASGELMTIANIPREAGQVSLGNTSYYLDAGRDPLYPFGFGLSYTTFAYSDLTLSAPEIACGENLRVACTVKNTGTREGAEIVQLYLRDLVGSVTRPVKELKGFDKILLKPGESRTVTFTLTPELLSFRNNDDRDVLEPGDFRVWVGPNSAEGLEGAFVLK